MTNPLKFVKVSFQKIKFYTEIISFVIFIFMLLIRYEFSLPTNPFSLNFKFLTLIEQ